jgi:hypothetical protein
MTITAIPTTYKGIEFRSRLEAKWAFVFDEIGWPWEYEPIDLNGYIPDFILTFAHAPMLVEVKPEFTIKDLRKAVPKILRSGWEKEALIVGGSLLGRYDAIGIMNDVDWGIPWSDGEQVELWTQKPEDWQEAEMFHCDEHKGIGICHSIHSYKCRVCGAHDGDHHKSGSAESEVRAAFNAATNAAKYRHGKR